jgi:phosphatidate cytidylyltransferase
MLWQRLLFGALLIAALLGLCYADERLPEMLKQSEWADACRGGIVTAIVAVLAVLASIELARLLRGAGHNPLVGLAALVSVVLVVAPHAARVYGGAADGDALEGKLSLAAIVLCLAAGFINIGARRSVKGSSGDLAATLLIVIYVGGLLSFLVRIRQHPAGSVGTLLFIIATIKACDIGAYFTGLAIGRHKLIEWLSPKKTWEGLLGGIAASVAVAFIPRWACADCGMSVTKCVVFGVTMALVGQAGDLLESLFKRDAQAKDSASAIPAFGGVLDVIDSLLLAAPAAYWLLIE